LLHMVDNMPPDLEVRAERGQVTSDLAGRLEEILRPGRTIYR
jgi:hypothetical protein